MHVILTHFHCYALKFQVFTLVATGWRRPVGYLTLQVIFRKRTNNHRALLQKMTYKDEASYGSSPPCSLILQAMTGDRDNYKYLFFSFSLSLSLPPPLHPTFTLRCSHSFLALSLSIVMVSNSRVFSRMCASWREPLERSAFSVDTCIMCVCLCVCVCVCVCV